MYTIGKLSKKTGVTVRTLDYYDEIGLLYPRDTSEGGHRLYGEDEVMRLEQILSLKYLGLSLEKIQLVLNESTHTWEEALTNQLTMVKEQKKQLEELERALNAVLYSIRIEGEVKWPLIFAAMQLFQQDRHEITKILDRYLDRDEQEKILSFDLDENKMKEWTEIIHEIRDHLHAPPESEIAQKLADKWLKKAYSMFDGDEEFMGKTWEAIHQESDGMLFYPMTKEVVTFITEAIRARDERD